MSRKKRYLLIAGITLIVVAAVFVVTKPSTPSGRFVGSSGIAVGGDYYWECSGGKLYFVCDDGRLETGAYFQKQDGWFLTNWYLAERHRSNAVPYKVECSWAGLTLSYTNGSREFWRRRVIPVRRPAWMIDWLPWSVQ